MKCTCKILLFCIGWLFANVIQNLINLRRSSPKCCGARSGTRAGVGGGWRWKWMAWVLLKCWGNASQLSRGRRQTNKLCRFISILTPIPSHYIKEYWAGSVLAWRELGTALQPEWNNCHRAREARVHAAINLLLNSAHARYLINGCSLNTYAWFSPRPCSNSKRPALCVCTRPTGTGKHVYLNTIN